jgi:hypothetical protein
VQLDRVHLELLQRQLVVLRRGPTYTTTSCTVPQRSAAQRIARSEVNALVSRSGALTAHRTSKQEIPLGVSTVEVLK